MARILAAEPIYQIANLFRERCLVNSDSLLWPDHSPWTIDNLSKLWDAFIGHPDTSQTSFFDKWKEQLSTQSEDVHRIAADFMVLYCLFPDKMGLKVKKK